MVVPIDCSRTITLLVYYVSLNIINYDPISNPHPITNTNPITYRPISYTNSITNPNVRMKTNEDTAAFINVFIHWNTLQHTI